MFFCALQILLLTYLFTYSECHRASIANHFLSQINKDVSVSMISLKKLVCFEEYVFYAVFRDFVCVCVSDESVIGGLSLLLMAGQHTAAAAAAAAATSPVLTDAYDIKPNSLLANAVTREAFQPRPCQVNYALPLVVVIVTLVRQLVLSVMSVSRYNPPYIKQECYIS